jgi:hypothetical protein
MKSVNYLAGHWDERDKNLFFGPLDEEEFIVIEGNLLAHVVAAAEIFPSVGQARKNGWDKPIPAGYSEYIAGKHKKRICVLNPSEAWA